MADKIKIQGVMLCQVGQQALEQRNITTGVQREVNISEVSCGGSARIDDHHFHIRALHPGLANALIEHRVTPGGI